MDEGCEKVEVISLGKSLPGACKICSFFFLTFSHPFVIRVFLVYKFFIVKAISFGYLNLVTSKFDALEVARVLLMPQRSGAHRHPPAVAPD